MVSISPRATIIDDPILLPIGADHSKILDEYFERTRCEFAFYDQWLDSDHHYVGLSPPHQSDIFCIVITATKKKYRIGKANDTIGTVSKEEFFDLLRDRFPDHFEWLLWHPELL